MEPSKEMSEGEQIPSLKMNFKRRWVTTFRSRGAPLDSVALELLRIKKY